MKLALPGRTRSASRPDPPCQNRSARAPNDFPLGSHPTPSAGEASPEKCPKRGFLRSPIPRSAKRNFSCIRYHIKGPSPGRDCCRNDCRELLALGSHRRKRTRLTCLLLVEFLDFRGPRQLGFLWRHASAEECQKSWTSRCSRSPESTSCCLLCHHLHTMSLGHTVGRGTRGGRTARRPC